MKNRINKIRLIEASNKLGEVEGVMITPMMAHKLLTYVDKVKLATENLYKLCKEVRA